MILTPEVRAALKSLHGEPAWVRLISALKEDSATDTKALVYATNVPEYDRGVLAGRVRAVQELVSLAEMSPQALDQGQSTQEDGTWRARKACRLAS